ncbi:MAG: tetratricopeptide repeat protein [Pseudomonadota bacterium]
MSTTFDSLQDLLWDDPESAKPHLESLVSENNADAMCVLAMGYYDGDFGDRDTAKAAELLESAVALGSPKAAHDLGCFKYYGYGFESGFRDVARAVELIESGVSSGHVPSMVFLAALLESGDEVNADLDRAIELYRLAASQGDAEAKDALSRLEK